MQSIFPDLAKPFGIITNGMLLRAGLFGAVLSLEAIAYAVGHVAGERRIVIARWGIAFVSSLVAFGYTRMPAVFRRLYHDSPLPTVSLRFLYLHLCAMAIAIGVVSPFLTKRLPSENSWIVDIIWCCSGAAGVVFAGLTFFSVRFWRAFFLVTWKTSICSAFVAAIATVTAPVLWRTWAYSRWTFGIDLTFWLVRLLLHPFLSGIVMERSIHVIGSDRFAVQIDGSCSGWEGLGLAATFTILSLWLSRREYKFPNALILIPAAMIMVFALNAMRIASLVLIGHYGSPAVAIRGFHSQAGWIAFNCVVLGVSLVGPRIHCLRIGEPGEQLSLGLGARSPSVPFLLPLTAILAAGMISAAASDGFERFYALRFFAAAAVLWSYRREYGIRGWRPSWFSLVSGAMVFVIWVIFDQGSHPNNGIATGLPAISTYGRICWILFRTLAAVITVPVAEELAFRGFLYRRIISSEFESVDLGSRSYPAIIGSSLAFGLLHGDRWIAGTVAGGVYALAMIRRGRICDAVFAHAVTNAILAAWVLFGRNWNFW